MGTPQAESTFVAVLEFSPVFYSIYNLPADSTEEASFPAVDEVEYACCQGCQGDYQACVFYPKP